MFRSKPGAAAMIVCSCMRISDRDIHDAIDWMRAADPQTLITPGKLYRALGKTPDCGGCVRLFVETMRGNDRLQIPVELRNLRPARASEGSRNEGRQGRNRVSQQGAPQRTDGDQPVLAALPSPG
jgi:bacterioferritin-associated ferredoxin